MRRSTLFWAMAAALLVGLQCTISARAAVDFDDDYEEYEEADMKTPPKASKKGPAAAAAASSSALKTTAAPQEETLSEVTIPMEHSLSGGAFIPCGSFTALVAQHATTKVVRLSKVKVKREPLSDAAKTELDTMLEVDAHYRVRVPGNVFGENPGRWAMSSLPLRCLVNADMTENFVLQIDDRGNIISMDYTTHSGECIQEETAPPASWSFKPMVYVRLPKDAPRLNPDYFMNYQAPSSGRGSQADAATSQMNTYASAPDGPDGKKKPEQSFLKKYWMYIVPVGLMMVNQLITPPEPEKKRKAQ